LYGNYIGVHALRVLAEDRVVLLGTRGGSGTQRLADHVWCRLAMFQVATRIVSSAAACGVPAQPVESATTPAASNLADRMGMVHLQTAAAAVDAVGAVAGLATSFNGG